MVKREEVRKQIIDAASVRFARFGYSKTSMAEIAGDCDMSPGNFYRYFENKLDVAECIVRNVFDKTLEAIRQAISDPRMSTRGKIQTFVLSEMEYTYQLLDEYPTLLDQAQEVWAKRPLCVNEYRANAHALLAEIMREGVAKGEFNIDDCVQMAKNFHSATLKFRYPQLHSNLPLEKLEREAKGVIRLLTKGISVKS